MKRVDIGAEAQSLADRLATVVLGPERRGDGGIGGSWTVDKDRAGRAITEHLGALGVDPRPVRWMEGKEEWGRWGNARAGFLAAWDAGQRLNAVRLEGVDKGMTLGSANMWGVERPSDAFQALRDAEKAGVEEQRAAGRKANKAANQASRVASRGTFRFAQAWLSWLAVEQAVIAASEWQRPASKKAGEVV